MITASSSSVNKKHLFSKSIFPSTAGLISAAKSLWGSTCFSFLTLRNMLTTGRVRLSKSALPLRSTSQLNYRIVLFLCLPKSDGPRLRHCQEIMVKLTNIGKLGDTLHVPIATRPDMSSPSDPGLTTLYSSHF